MNLRELSHIINGIRQHYPVSDLSIRELAEHLEPHALPKQHHLYQPGSPDDHVYFIEKGCARTYLLVDGKEITSWFSQEGDLVFSSLSLYHRSPGFEHIQLLEDALVYALPVKALNALYTTHIDIANWSRMVHQEALLKMQQLRLDRLSLSAEQRYAQFVEENPALVHRVNLGYIASYLGMTQQHLSVLRSNRTILR
jgi:CRP-like cAMP-binding protein